MLIILKICQEYLRKLYLILPLTLDFPCEVSNVPYPPPRPPVGAVRLPGLTSTSSSMGSDAPPPVHSRPDSPVASGSGDPVMLRPSPHRYARDDVRYRSG